MNTQVQKVKNKAGELKWWQVALISVAVSFLGSLSGGNDRNRQKLYSRKLKQAPWAPPAWLFAPAWTINNFFLLLGLQKMIDNKNIPEKRKLLLIQGMIWAIFFSFNYVYFRKRSTILAAIWTAGDAVLALASMTLAARGSDKKNTLYYLPLSVWTLFASTLAGYQALKNDDEALGIKALIA